MSTFGGIRIIESIYHTQTVMDFSRCRSPGRAKRRYVRGIRGRVRLSEVPRKDAVNLDGVTLVMHPEMARAEREAIKSFGEQWTAGEITPKLYLGAK